MFKSQLLEQAFGAGLRCYKEMLFVSDKTATLVACILQPPLFLQLAVAPCFCRNKNLCVYSTAFSSEGADWSGHTQTRYKGQVSDMDPSNFRVKFPAVHLPCEISLKGFCGDVAPIKKMQDETEHWKC